VSIVEGIVLSIIDKFALPRKTVIAAVGLVGVVGSVMFAMPIVIDKGLASDGTLGLTLLDLFDHWAFGYGLLICGLLECIILGWLYDFDKLRGFINENASFKLGAWFKYLVRFVIPILILLIIGFSIADEVKNKLYGSDFKTGDFTWLYGFAFIGWLLFCTIGAVVFTWWRRAGSQEGEQG